LKYTLFLLVIIIIIIIPTTPASLGCLQSCILSPALVPLLREPVLLIHLIALFGLFRISRRSSCSGSGLGLRRFPRLVELVQTARAIAVVLDVDEAKRLERKDVVALKHLDTPLRKRVKDWLRESARLVGVEPGGRGGGVRQRKDNGKTAE
jgi:hypothetical protein